MRVKKALIMIILLLPFVVHAGELNIYNIAEGCTMFESNGNYLLIDDCEYNYEIDLFLERKNVKSYDLLITNYNNYHESYENDNSGDSVIKINKVYIPDISSIKKYLTDEFKATNEESWKILSGINEYNSYVKSSGEKYNFDVIELKTGDSFKFGDANVDIVAPTREFTIDDTADFSEQYNIGPYVVPLVSIDNRKMLVANGLDYVSTVDLLEKKTLLNVNMLTIGSRQMYDCDLFELIKAFKPLYFYVPIIERYQGKGGPLLGITPSCNLESELPGIGNVYSFDNGVVTWNVKDGEISTKRCDNCAKVEINYIDKNSKKELGYYSSYYSTSKPYYLCDTKKEFKNFKYVDDDITDGDVIRGDRVFTVNYEEIPVVINHKYDSNSDEAKVVMLVQKYVNDNLRSKLYLNNLSNWNALSVDYMGETKDGKEYYLKTAIDCAGDVKCIEDATDFDSNNNQYLYNAYVIVDGNSNVKLSFEKSSLVEDEIGEGEVENPKTGSYISLFIVMTAFLMIVAIGFIVRKNKIYNIR